MSIRSQKAGNQFGRIALKDTGVLTPEEWAIHMLNAGFPANPRVIGEGLGIIFYESSFNASSRTPGNEHMGGWAESSAYGSTSQRLRASTSTRAAYIKWKESADKNGGLYGNFHKEWGQWQEAQRPDGKSGEDQYPTYMGIANRAIQKSGRTPSGDGGGWIGGVPDPGDLLEAGGDALDSALSAGEFLAELAATVLDFRKLGQLAVEAFAWFLRLLAKAIWTYVIAPAVHWSERAVTWYWTNFFTTGTERGSGFGYALRQNAGIITIGFWAIGYAVLWTDGTSFTPADANGSMLGRSVKGIEGKIARRNLVKPEKVESETPNKPDAKSSTVTVEKVKEFSVTRKRPVSVQPTGQQQVTGRKENDGSSRESGRVPRPEAKKPESPEQKIILPAGVKTDAEQTKKEQSAKPSGAELGSRVDSSDRA